MWSRYFITLLLLVLLQSCNNKYLVRSFGDKGEFIVPPKSNFSLRDGSTVNRGSRYVYIYMNGLNDQNYFRALKGINKVETFSSEFSIDEYCFDVECIRNGCNAIQEAAKFRKKYKPVKEKDLGGLGLLGGGDACIIREDIGDYCVIKYAPGRNRFLLQIDYTRLITDTAGHEAVVMNFQRLALQLMEALSRREGVGEKQWCRGVSPAIVEKIFELIPIPQESSLARYGCIMNKSRSFVLVNPKITLQVDATELLDETGNWQFRQYGTYDIKISRDTNGRIVQSPFHRFAYYDGKPDNIIDKGKNIVLQASSAEIQFSSSLRSCAYIFLVQNRFKNNNKTSSIQCSGAQTEFAMCNSQLWHFDKLTSFYEETMTGTVLQDTARKYLSAFGYRNLVIPQIDIYINDRLESIPLGTTFPQLMEAQAVPSDLKIYRLYGGRYARLEGDNLDQLILLPGDLIKYATK